MKGNFNLLAVTTVQWVIIVIVAVIVFAIIMHFVNRAFRIRYDLNLLGGGLLMILSAGAGVGGYFLVKDGNNFGFALFAVAAILIILTLIYDCKKCGAMGVVALICQILFSVGSLLILIEFFTNHGYVRGQAAESWKVRKARERLGYDKKDDFYR